MAQHGNGSVDISFVNSLVADPVYQSGANAQVLPVANYAETKDVAALRTALNTFDTVTYTQAALDNMSVNDMVYAWRMCRGNHTTVSNYAIAQVSRNP